MGSPILTSRQKIMLAALAADGGAEFAPVQIQKLFFLIDENAAGHLGGKLFAFEPYDYGPFDKAVYRELDLLAAKGLVEVRPRASGHRAYTLTMAGQRTGEAVLTSMSAPVRAYFSRASQWVRSLSFPALVGSIYKAYPHMRAKSIFVEK